MNQSIANQLIKNLERENELLQKRCSNLEKAVQKSEPVILEQNEIIHELQDLCDKQQKPFFKPHGLFLINLLHSELLLPSHFLKVCLHFANFSPTYNHPLLAGV